MISSDLPTNILYAFLFPPFMLHALPIHPLDLIILIILGKEYYAPHVVFCNLPSLHLSSIPIFSSAPCSVTPSGYVPPLMSETNFHTHTEQRQNYSFIYSNFYIFGPGETTKVLD
jgi:hypothetical protein